MNGVPDWQALLFVPVGAERHLASACRHRPDAIILDLEDAIPPAAKAAARAQLRADQAMVAEAGIPCVLRVNAPLVAMAQDIAAADQLSLAAVMVPKCETARPLMNAAELAGDGIGLIALAETPAALTALPTLAGVPQVIGLMLGSEDYSATLGIDPDGGGLTVLAAHLAAAAASRGLLAIGFPGSIANFRDLDRYGAQLQLGRSLGMNAAAAIHPAQLGPIWATLAPTAAEIDWARKVVSGSALQGGVLAIDGQMIDAPVLKRAARILTQTERRALSRTSAKVGKWH